ncbi:hypothetical protein J4468_00085 [Candidatus Woesearchaeota archaeon]|nr:hypothetical protein [Candidatus Woesearchaeota archaeon]
MTSVSLDKIYGDLQEIKGEIEFIKHLMEEKYELSEWAKEELKDARKQDDSHLVSNDEVRKRILKK